MSTMKEDFKNFLRREAGRLSTTLFVRFDYDTDQLAVVQRGLVSLVKIDFDAMIEFIRTHKLNTSLIASYADHHFKNLINGTNLDFFEIENANRHKLFIERQSVNIHLMTEKGYELIEELIKQKTSTKQLVQIYDLNEIFDKNSLNPEKLFKVEEK